MSTTMSTNRKTSGRNTLGSYGSNPTTAPTTGPTYVFPKNGNIPTGQYPAIIDKIKPSITNRGNPAIDVHYTLKSSTSKVYYAKQRIAKGTVYMDIFLSALSRAGVNVSNVEPHEVSNVNLNLDLDYDENGLGKITFPLSTVGKSVGTQKKATMADLLAEDEADDLEEDIEAYLEDEAE